MSTEPRPIKVPNTASSETTRADEVQIKTAKTGKLTVEVAVMSILVKKDTSCGVLIVGMRSLLAKIGKVPIFWRKIPADQEAFLRN